MRRTWKNAIKKVVEQLLLFFSGHLVQISFTGALNVVESIVFIVGAICIALYILLQIFREDESGV